MDAFEPFQVGWPVSARLEARRRDGSLILLRVVVSRIEPSSALGKGHPDDAWCALVETMSGDSIDQAVEDATQPEVELAFTDGATALGTLLPLPEPSLRAIFVSEGHLPQALDPEQ